MRWWITAKDKYQEQLEMGKLVEQEHKNTVQFIKDTLKKTGELPTDEEIFEHIAKDHLKEFADYYTRLKEIEK